MRAYSFPSAVKASGTGPSGKYSTHGRLLFVLLLSALVFACSEKEGSNDARVIKSSFYSKSLKRDMNYVVLLPEWYEISQKQRFPLVILLHGFGGEQGDWIYIHKLDTYASLLERKGLIRRMIYAMPQGDNSFYADKYDGTADYEKYIVNDFVGHIDGNYRTIPDRLARSIGGISMGGIGAMQLAFRHRDLVSSAASHSGPVSLRYTAGDPWRSPDDSPYWTDPDALPQVNFLIVTLARPVFGPDVEKWKAYNPVDLAENLKPGELKISIDAGYNDPLAQMGMDLHIALRDRGIDHDFRVSEGMHEDSYWDKHMEEYLMFHSRSMERWD
jgi:S-formylglutathione hydrolase FrmB